MSRLVTQLVADEPAVVLVGSPSVLRERLVEELSGNSVAIHVVDSSKIANHDELLASAYKIVWVYDENFSSGTNYLEIVSQLKKYSAPIVVVVPITTFVESVALSELEKWKTDSEQQFQFIVDVNYNLPKASFVFGLNVIGNSTQRNFVPYITAKIRRKKLIDPQINFTFISLDDFVRKTAEQIFIPRQQLSVLVKGKDTDRTQFLSLLKKLYDAYHAIHLEIITDIVKTNSPTPFSVTEITVPSDTRSVVTHVVRQLPAPSHEVEEISQPLPTPRPVESQGSHQERIMQEPQAILETRNVQPNKIQVKTKEEDSQEDENIELEEAKTKPSTLEMDPSSLEDVESQREVEPTVDINSEIQRIFKDTRKKTKVRRVEKIVKSTKKIKKKSKRRTGMFYGGLLSIGMAIGIIVLAITYFFSGMLLKRQLISVIEYTAETKNFATELNKPFLSTVSFVQKQTDVYGTVLENNVIAKNSVLVDLAQQFILLPTVLSEANEASKNLVLKVLSGSDGDTVELTETLGIKVQEAYENLSLLQANLQQIDLGDNSQEQQKLISNLESNISETRKSLAIQQQLQPVLPQLFGSERKKTYALLLQNNQELRPTGGFIQAVALVTLQDGSLLSYQVYSVYELDKQLPGKVIPPDDIKKYLGEESWYLRDSNWDPDFYNTSTQVEWFLEKALGVSVDGVIGINVYTLEEIVEAVGPIEIPEYNEVITHKNIEERMEFHSEVILVDSPDSVDYAVNILQKVFKELQTIESEEIPTLLSGLQDSFEEKQLQISSFDESEQSIFEALGWAGTLSIPSCPARLESGNCHVDVLAQVEANVGVNKANYYLEREINHNIYVSSEVAQHTRSISFENTAQSNAWPKGTYNSYQRFYLDKEAQLESVKINGSPLVEEQLTVEKKKDFQLVGFRVSVPIQKQVTVEVSYSTPLSSGQEQDASGISYVFYNRKQSGIDSDPFTVTISHDPSLQPTLIAPSASISGSTITFDAQSLDEAALFGVKFN